MLRSSPWLMSCEERPSPLAVFGKSKAMRGGFETAKFGGTLPSGSLVVTRTTVLPPCWLTSKPSMVFPCAATRPMPRSQRSDAYRSVLVFIFCASTEYGGAKAGCALSFLRLDQLQGAVALHPFAAAVLHQLLQLDLSFVDGRDHAEVLAHVVALADAVDVGYSLDEREVLLLLRD